MVVGGKSVWERIGLEADLDDYESPEKGLGVLKDMVEDFHKKSNPEPEFMDVKEKFFNVSTGKMEY